MSNRIEALIVRRKAAIAERIAQNLTTEAKVEETRKAFDMELDEFCRFQELKSLAFAEGKITHDEAQSVYGYLGTTPDHFNGQPVEVKAVLTSLFAELLNLRIRSTPGGKERLAQYEAQQKSGVTPAMEAAEASDVARLYPQQH